MTSALCKREEKVRREWKSKTLISDIGKRWKSSNRAKDQLDKMLHLSGWYSCSIFALVPGSSLDPETGCPNWGFYLSHSRQKIPGQYLQLGPWLLPSMSLNLLLISRQQLTVSALTVPLNKLQISKQIYMDWKILTVHKHKMYWHSTMTLTVMPLYTVTRFTFSFHYCTVCHT